jgi:hypothetical protein
MAAALLALPTAACAADDERPTMSYQQAADTVEQLIRDATGAVRPVPRMEPFRAISTVPCFGPDDSRETGNVMVEHNYWLRDIAPELNEDIVRQAHEYWTNQGYQIAAESSSAASGRHEVTARHPETRFTIRIASNDGVLMVGAQSTCVRRPAT